MEYILLDSAYQVYGDITLCDTGLVIRLFGIPIRKYMWSEVNSIIFLHTWKDRENLPDSFGIIKGNAFMISLKGCPPFHPEYDSRIYFLLKYPLASIFFTVSPWKKVSYIEFMKNRYPEIRIQPSDLS